LHFAHFNSIHHLQPAELLFSSIVNFSSRKSLFSALLLLSSTWT
jgi:hypothetical protein